jgi:primosomal protein N' (replication factor Y)
MTKTKQVYIDTILPLPVRGFFTYIAPANLVPDIEIGKRVMVEFGTKKIYTAIVFKIHNNKPQDFETKPILSVLDKTPIINSRQLKLWKWSADYYMCSIGDFYKASVPAGLRLESETKITRTKNTELPRLNSNQQLIISALDNQQILTINDIAKILDVKNPMPLINGLLNIDAITTQERIKNDYKPKISKYIQLHKNINSKNKIDETFEKIRNAPKQIEALNSFIDTVGIDNALNGKRVQKQKLIKQINISTAILKSLCDKDILHETEDTISRLSTNNITVNDKKELNKYQSKALQEINNIFTDKDIVLLHGVTSSGKTEIYIHLIEEALKKEKQVLYLLPEIALTSQITTRLKAVFGNKVGIYHSKFSDAERVEIWNNLANNNTNSYKIILGVRSSIFLPFSNLGLIIVDEEHENTYKQYDPAPRYNARDLSIVLAKNHNAKVLLGTATPSIESYYNVQTDRYGLVELLKRHKDIELPEIIISDIKREYKRKTMQSHFSPSLIQNIKEALNKNEQIILFQNRRGFSPLLKCESCGWVPSCKWCDVSLTYHKAIDKLICHYCGYSTNTYHKCPECNEENIKTKGFGTEKIENEIAEIFPKAKTGRLDLDTTRGKHSHEVIINNFQQQNIDILIGTQMVSKGLDFDHVSVVGILSADSMLQYPDFRAY